MVKGKVTKRTGKARKGTTDIQDLERMTERALSAIGKTGTADALGKCRVLIDLINAHLEEVTSEHFVDASAVADLQAFLERAATVLKKMCCDPATPRHDASHSLLPALAFLLMRVGFSVQARRRRVRATPESWPKTRR